MLHVKKKGFFIAAFIFVLLLVVWFYFPIYPKITDTSQIYLNIIYHGQRDLDLDLQQKEAIYELVENIVCQRRIFLYTKKYPREEKNLIDILMHGEKGWYGSIEIVASTLTPKDSYINIDGKEYLILNPQDLIDKMKEIVE